MAYILFTIFVAVVAYALGELDGWNRARWHYNVEGDGK